MELLAELLLTVLGWVAEVVLQVAFEALAEMGLRTLGEPFKPAREASPLVAAVGYAIYGAAIGGISLWFFPAPYLEAPWARIANVAVSPLAAGAVMSMLGAWRRGRGEALIRLDRFSYGALFALSMALVRFAFAEAQ
jgi:hypothetical protein